MIITLIGMPGAGKTCIGKTLASKSKIKLIDSDKLIESIYQKKLQVLIDEEGIEAFRRIEEETLLGLDPDEDIILSTGGSAVYSEKAMRYLGEKGKIIYLYCSYRTVKDRLGDFSKRGVVLKPGQDLLGLYNERVPLYEKFADYTLNCDGRAYKKYQTDALELVRQILIKNKNVDP